MTWFSGQSLTRDLQAAHCIACGRDTTQLQLAARFCPDCGAKLQMAHRRRFQMCRQILPLIHLGRGELFDAELPVRGRTAILIGYANAMYRLGWRYERGSGIPRNLPEATRCYTKSARLGNLDAMIRLAPAQIRLASTQMTDATQAAPVMQIDGQGKL